MSHHAKHRHGQSVQRFLKGAGTLQVAKDGFDRRSVKRYTAKRRRQDDQDHIEEQIITITKYTADFPLSVTLNEEVVNGVLTLGQWLTTWEERFENGCLRLDLVHLDTGDTAVADFFRAPEYARARVISPERGAVVAFIDTFRSFAKDGVILVHTATVHGVTPQEEANV